MIDRLRRANIEFGITLLIIEHNMRVVMNMTDKIYCLAHGELLAEGSPEEIQNDQRVIDAYLGGGGSRDEPGPEARRALAAGRHVMIFSDHVPLADEIALKTEAVERGLEKLGRVIQKA